jgi:hypothetical protein
VDGTEGYVPESSDAQVQEIELIEESLALCARRWTITDLNHPTKTPRPFFDGSHRPSDFGSTINDWVSLETEPELIFGKAFYFTAMWIWRLRACYPWKEILLHDNDVGSCFRRVGHHPNCASVMLFLWGIYLFCYARLSFGGNYCPPNWEALAIARMEVAIHLWKQLDTIERAAKFMPPITFAAPPTPEQVAAFVQANLDEFVKSVFDEHGNRLPCPMKMHVDDALCAEIYEYFILMVSCSVLSLYIVLGSPKPDKEPDSLSWKKWDPLSTHQRKFCGIDVDSRAMTLSMVPAKRAQFLDELSGWLRPGAKFSLGDIARLTGVIGDHCRICRWAKLYSYNIVNQLRWILNVRYRQLVQGRDKSFADRIGAPSKGMQKRLDQLIARAKAKVLWQNHGMYEISGDVRRDLQFLFTYLSDRSNPWSMSIGHFIKRAPIGCSYGDASTGRGMGFYSPTHKFYCVMVWSDELRRAIHHKNHTTAVHINQLEMVAYIMQLAAVVTAIQHPDQLPNEVAVRLRNCPTAPQWLVYVDNMTTKFWGEKGIATKLRGQLLLRIQAALYHTSDVHGHTEYIKSEDNVLADLLSRSPEPPLTDDAFSTFIAQVLASHPEMKTYYFFLPSQDFLCVLRSVLLTNVSLTIHCLPKKLGRFVRTAPTTLDGVTL